MQYDDLHHKSVSNPVRLDDLYPTILPFPHLLISVVRCLSLPLSVVDDSDRCACKVPTLIMNTYLHVNINQEVLGK